MWAQVLRPISGSKRRPGDLFDTDEAGISAQRVRQLLRQRLITAVMPPTEMRKGRRDETVHAR